MVWIPTLVLALGCGSEADTPLRSAPTTPTVELGDPAGLGVKWAELDGFVTGTAPEIPKALGGLTIGMAEADAAATLERVREPRIPAAPVMSLRGHRMHGVVLVSHPDVMVTAIVDGEAAVVREIDVALPEDQALYAFTAAWGEPTMEADPVQGPVAVWRSDALVVRMFPAESGRAVVKFAGS